MLDIFKEPYVIVTFATTTDAMAGEAAFKQKKLPGRLIPVPSHIKAGCGMCWYSQIDAKKQITECVENEQIAHQEILTNEKQNSERN